MPQAAVDSQELQNATKSHAMPGMYLSTALYIEGIKPPSSGWPGEYVEINC